MLAEGVLVERSEIGLVAKNPQSEKSSFRYACYLEEEDIKNIQDCIRQLIVQSIVPWMEARVREWNEVFLQSKKGMAGRLFGAGKNLFRSTGHVTLNLSKGDAV
jgi:hypothetical protein